MTAHHISKGTDTPAQPPADPPKITGSGRRDLHGVVLLDKPSGITSNRALQWTKRLFGAAKAGHTGSLDPLATGMLPICFGEATKLTGFMLAADKEYRVKAHLGIATDTADSEGKTVAEAPVPPLVEDAIRQALTGFTGEIQQVPPMYSALKHEGQRLYTLARQGIEVLRPARTVSIHQLRLLAFTGTTLELEVSCSKGTYIRTLVEDIALRLGTVGHVSALRRLAVRPFAEGAMASMEQLEAASNSTGHDIERFILPVDSVVLDWPRLDLDSELIGRLVNGQAVSAELDWPRSRVRLYSMEGRLVGIGEVLEAGELLPRRIFPGLGPWS